MCVCVCVCRAETGFKHVKPTEYQPRLLHFHGNKVKYAVIKFFNSPAVI